MQLSHCPQHVSGWDSKITAHLCCAIKPLSSSEGWQCWSFVKMLKMTFVYMFLSNVVCPPSEAYVEVVWHYYTTTKPVRAEAGEKGFVVSGFWHQRLLFASYVQPVVSVAFLTITFPNLKRSFSWLDFNLNNRSSGREKAHTNPFLMVIWILSFQYEDLFSIAVTGWTL